MEKRVRIQDVARQAGVSITTVSRFLNERYDSMSVETRARIEHVILELGYRPNALAQGLKGNRTKFIAAIVVNMSYPFCVGFMRALNQTLSQAGYHLFVSETDGDAEKERAVIESLRAQRVDAMVLQTGGQNHDLLETIAALVPVIFVDRAYSVPGVTNVVTNNIETSRELTKHLFAAGYQRVLYVTEVEAGIHTRKERLEGYLEACRSMSVEPLVITVNRDIAETLTPVVDVVRQEAKRAPIAVYTGNGLVMMRLYPKLAQLDLQVPDQLGLATFDQPEWAQMVSPTLTCVRQPVEDMGALTGRMILSRLSAAQPSIDSTSRVEQIASTLIFGGSTRTQLFVSQQHG